MDMISKDIKLHWSEIFVRKGYSLSSQDAFPPSPESTVPTCARSNILRNSLGELVILVNCLARTINPGGGELTEKLMGS